MKCTARILCACLLMGSAFVCGAAPGENARAKAPQLNRQASPTSEALVEQVRETLQLRGAAVMAVDVRNEPDGFVTTDIIIDGEHHTLELAPYSIRSTDYQLLAQQPDGSLAEIEPGPVNTLRGYVVGVEGSAVAAAWEPDGLHARIFLPDQRQYWLQPIAMDIPAAAVDDYALYRNDDIIGSQHPCGSDIMPQPLARQQQDNGRQIQGASACGTGLCVADLACDADFEFYQAWGSVNAVEARINSVINAVNIQYERDVDITHQISAIIVRAAEPDPYTTTDALALVWEFRDHWNANHGDIPRDTAQLFTGKNVDSNTIGIAWLNAVCTVAGYGLVESDCCGSDGCATDLSAHELGHNWGANHCNCTLNTMNPFITCNNVFHSTFTVPEVESFRDSLTCLEGIAQCTVDSECDDGVFCNGDETCDTGLCVAGNDPCPGEDCDESNTICIPLICNSDGTCNGIEECKNCSIDCISGPGPGCGNGICEPSLGEDCLSCSQDCNGKQNGNPNNRYCCGDGDGVNPLDCNDDPCNGQGNTCSDTPAVASCCGDYECEGIEDAANCAIDCAVGCGSDDDCVDVDACTIGICSAGGICVNEPMDCPDGDACTSVSCDPDLGCVYDPISCDDDDTCSMDSCDSVTGCSNEFPACGDADGCCGPNCDANDPDCAACLPSGASCEINADCCSNKCKGFKCRGN